MCGINGIAFSSRSGRQVNSGELKRMRDVITHRGPDDEGLFIAGPIGLGHRRLSIVDVRGSHLYPNAQRISRPFSLLS